MHNNCVTILDTTLRDGAQAEGVSFSVRDKVRVTHALDKLGVTYIEAGNPGSNPKDAEVFEKLSNLTLLSAKVAAFGSTRRKDCAVRDDPAVAALLGANTPVVVVFGKAWDFHATDVLNVSLDENIAMIRETVLFLKEKNKEVIFDAEHFFDGYKSNPAYAMLTLKTAADAGADILCMCDTNGGAFPRAVYEITQKVCGAFSLPVGIHPHNDCGMATANAVTAVEAGALHVQGTLTGFGERCGNAPLSAIIPNLQLKLGIRVLPDEKLALLTDTCRLISEIANESIRKREPYIGKSAFAHKGGMHIAAVVKNPASFEHINPALVGNTRRSLTSEMSGRGAVLAVINRINPALSKDCAQTKEIIRILKEREKYGYQYEAAECSFEILIRKHIGEYKPFFELADFSVTDDYPSVDGQSSRATIKIYVNDREEITAADGDGPVNALDRALRKALEVFYPALKEVRLTDYKVRVIDSPLATAAKVRVLIESADANESWSTVGVSTDIIQASRLALVDSLEYKLIKEANKGSERT